MEHGDPIQGPHSNEELREIAKMYMSDAPDVPDVQLDRRPDIGFDVIQPGHHPYLALPPFLLGKPVIAAITMDDREGLLPRRHIAVIHDARKGEQGYSTHYVAFQMGYGWVLNYGHYDLSRDRALQDMGEREARER